MTKAVILGLTNSGKSTTSAHLKEMGWPVIEVDDIAQEKNNGIWPESEAVLDVLFQEANDEVIKLVDVAYVTSFLDRSDVEHFYNAGFKIIELHATYKELRRRRISRDGEPTDNWERFDRNYNYYQKIVPDISNYFSLSIDTTNVDRAELAATLDKELRR